LDLKLEFILIGDELLSGHKKDANLHQLTGLLSQRGLSLRYVQVIGDKMPDIIQAMNLAASRSQIIITSGGLGPTRDDLTKDALAESFNLPLMHSPEAAQVVLSHYQRVGRDCRFEINRYDQIPKESEALFNPVGFAPGIYFENNENKFNILLAPGVPKEFHAIIDHHLDKILKFHSHFKAKKQLCWKTFGIPEEKIFSELCPTLWSDLAKMGRVASLPHLSGVDITLTLDADRYESLKTTIDQVIHSSGLTPYIWTKEKISLPEFVVQLAKKKKVTFSFVESCTGGMASHLVTLISGCSEVFKGSIVSYQTQIKNSLLEIDSSITQEDGVNELTAQAMSLNGKKKLHADYCLSFTGFAGPNGGTKDNPVGRLWLCLTDKEGNHLIKKLDLIGNRQDRIERFTYAGLHFLRQELEKLVE